MTVTYDDGSRAEFNEGDIVTTNIQEFGGPVYIIYNLREGEADYEDRSDFFCLDNSTIYEDINSITLRAFKVIS